MSLASRNRRTSSLAFLDSSGNAAATLVCTVRQLTHSSRRSSLREQFGLNDAEIILQARLVSPKRLPGAVKAGMRAELTWSGRKGVARVEPYSEMLSNRFRDRYGEAIMLSWQSDEIT